MPVPIRDLYIALARLPFLTPARARLLREHFDPLTEVCTAPPKVLEGLLAVDSDHAEMVRNPLRSREARRAVESLRPSALTLADDYPPLLREIIDPPLALFCRGDRSLLTKPA